MTAVGNIVVLNGTPRSGKTSIARAVQTTLDGLWLNLGVDAFSHGITPARSMPGIGLRPGGERPDLEPVIPILYDALYDLVIAQCSVSVNVVVDVGHHDDYSTPMGVLDRVSIRLKDLPAYFIGVRCPIDVIVERRGEDDSSRPTTYLQRSRDGSIPEPVLRWERAVHDPGMYDLEVDTSRQSPEECAAAIRNRMVQGSPTAFGEISQRARDSAH